jgi:hypothetical protein
MDDKRLMWELREYESLSPGIIVHGRTSSPIGSATFRVVLHDGITIRDTGSDWRELVAADAVALRTAIYTQSVLGNGWQPHEQPSPAAYLPLRYDQLHPLGTSGTTGFFVEAAPRLGRAHFFIDLRATDEFVLDASGPAERRTIATLLSLATGAAQRDVMELLAAMIRGQQPVRRAA